MSLISKLFYPRFLVRAVITVPLFLLIGIILSAMISPIEFIRIQRDRQRTDDLKNLSDLIIRAQSNVPESVKAQGGLVYISLPDNDPTCSSWQLPQLAGDFSYHCSPNKSYRAVNGIGWLPIDFTALPSVDIQQLPIDPANGKESEDLTTGQKRILFYQYINGSFSLGAFSERPPQLDEVYGAASKRKAVQEILGVDSTEVGIGGGGQMIIVGRADLISEANAPSISAIGKQIEEQAVQDVLERIKELPDKTIILEELGITTSIILNLEDDKQGREIASSFAPLVSPAFGEARPEKGQRNDDVPSVIARESQRPKQSRSPVIASESETSEAISRADTDNDGYADSFETTTYGIAPQVHPYLTNKQAKNRVELLSNQSLVNALIKEGYLKEADGKFLAPPALNPFYPDQDGDGVGDIWEITYFKTDPYGL